MRNRTREVEETTMSNRENEGSESPPSDEEGGYGKPPKRRRFKGSGNPRGRPKGAKNRKTIIRTVANEMHTLVENGTCRRLSTLELVMLRLRNMALEGNNVRAFDELHRLIKAYGPQEADKIHGVLVAPAEISNEEWIAEQEERNKTRTKPEDERW